MATRDIDIVLHSEKALDDFESQFPASNLVWRRRGRTTFKECHLRDAEPFPPLVDVFTTDLRIGARRFGLQKATNVEPEAAGQRFIPRLPYLVGTKLRAIPLRSGPEALDKQAKDLFDLHQLVFLNMEGMPSTRLRMLLPIELRRPAAQRVVARAIRHRPEFSATFQRIHRWLTTP